MKAANWFGVLMLAASICGLPANAQTPAVPCATAGENNAFLGI
jgi:hypothetical protein